MTEYRVQFTVEARTAYDSLPGERQAQLDKAVGTLARDPFCQVATAQMGADEHLRRAYVTPGMMLEYVVAGTVMVVVMLEISDKFAYLVDESDAC